MLINFETLLSEEFGAKQAVGTDFPFALQFSRITQPEQQTAMRAATRAQLKSVREFVEKFRSSLSDDVSSDQAYSYKVFLIPKVGPLRCIQPACKLLRRLSTPRNDRFAKPLYDPGGIQTSQPRLGEFGLIRQFLFSTLFSSLPRSVYSDPGNRTRSPMWPTWFRQWFWFRPGLRPGSRRFPRYRHRSSSTSAAAQRFVFAGVARGIRQAMATILLR
jgi:hypothetical protein